MRPNQKHSPDYFHQKLGRILWSACGMSREMEALKAAMKDISELESEFLAEH